MDDKVAILVDFRVLRQLTIYRLQSLQRAANEALDRIHLGQAETKPLPETAALLAELDQLLENASILFWKIT